MKPFILTGFMGCGKSTVGRALAKELRSDFLDADIFFAEQAGITPAFYIKRFGLEAFRKLEAHYLKIILKNRPGVLATGGGVVLKPFSRHLILQNGFVVWLEVPLPLILIRLNQRALPPMLKRPILLAHLQELYAVREPCYQKCHGKILNAYASPKEVAIQILEKYKF